MVERHAPPRLESAPSLTIGPDWRLAKPKMHAASRPDPPPDAPDYKQDVQCEHGGLSANITARRRISSEVSDVQLERYLIMTCLAGSLFTEADFPLVGPVVNGC